PEHMVQAHSFFKRALAIDPRSVGALVGMAMVDLTVGGYLFDDRTARCLAAETKAIKALSLAPNHAVAHLALGMAYIFTNHAAQGLAECEQAFALSPNLADAHACSVGFAGPESARKLLGDRQRFGQITHAGCVWSAGAHAVDSRVAGARL